MSYAAQQKECVAEVSSFVKDGLSSPSVPHNYPANTSAALLLLVSIPLNPFHCSAVKSTSRQADYSPPSAAFITKFMMKQFCVLLLQWPRYQGQTCSQRTEYISCDCPHSRVTRVWWDGMGWDGLGDKEAWCRQETTSRWRSLCGKAAPKPAKSKPFCFCN